MAAGKEANAVLAPAPRKAETAGKPAEALYTSVARSLKDEIVGGLYPVGARLPTEAELCQRFSVSRNTIRDALKLLRDERLVASRQGAGTVVIAPTSSESFVLEAQSINDLVAYAADMHTEIQSTRMERVKARQAARIGLPGVEEWLVVRGIVHSKKSELPICLSEYYINQEFAAVGRLLPRHTGPIFLLLEDLFGLSITELDQDISTGILTQAQAETLGAQAGATSIEVRRAFRITGNKVAQIAIHTHAAERFRQSMKMRRFR